ncbi:hypothetical protein [Henriciella litoralis]|uniref:hypothetical protein n=1 Tax=Henriciella litoralis TaxID=568102 RepID=UPI000A04D0F9|nr:hypothetical protein [Henriciella litoralis]
MRAILITVLLSFLMQACTATGAAQEAADPADLKELEIIRSYHLMGGELADLMDTWAILESHREPFEAIGYTILPQCFYHSRYETEGGTVITFGARNPNFLEECSAFGNFHFFRENETEAWRCSRVVNRQLIPCEAPPVAPD